MSKSKLLILDANLVIRLHEYDLWSAVIDRYEIRLAKTVVDESMFYEIAGQREYIDLQGDIVASRITIFDVDLSDLRIFLSRFDRNYMEKLDAGELESLVYLDKSIEPLFLASGDAIVFKVLCQLNRTGQGISLEEVLQKAGLSKSNLPWSCQKAFREKCTKEGQQDSIQGRGRKS
jgi:hypothetical protein